MALGTGAYLTYNAVMLCFATPLDSLFPAYVVMLGAWLPAGRRRARRLDAHGGPGRSSAPVDRTDALDGTGLTTNPVWVQDLSFWLPVMAWVGPGALGVVRARPLLVAAGLAFWTLESVGVGVDQWWGHRADPTSEWASSGAVVLFATTALVDLVLLCLALRWTRTTREPRVEHRVDAPVRPRSRTAPD